MVATDNVAVSVKDDPAFSAILEAEDVKFQRALETGADTTDIVAEKQRLRDITNDVDAMTTEAQLKAKITELESGE